MLAATGQWLPLYLLAATAEAAIVLWLAWRRTPPAWRSGLVATLRRQAAVRALAAGRTVTSDGCAVGVDVRSGRLAGVSWAAAERGLLLAGDNERQLAWPALGVVCAAIRRRKTVLVLDLRGANGAVAHQVAALAASLGVPASDVTLPAGGQPAGRLEAIIGRAMRRREVVAIRAAADGWPAGGAHPAVAALASVLASLRDLGLRGDCLAWIAGCDSVDDGTLRDLLALGPQTGTAVLLSGVKTGQPLPAAGLVLTDSPSNAATSSTQRQPRWSTMRYADGQRPPATIRTVPVGLARR